jgi:hypothetical protein
MLALCLHLHLLVQSSFFASRFPTKTLHAFHICPLRAKSPTSMCLAQDADDRLTVTLLGALLADCMPFLLDQKPVFTPIQKDR